MNLPHMGPWSRAPNFFWFIIEFMEIILKEHESTVTKIPLIQLQKDPWKLAVSQNTTDVVSAVCRTSRHWCRINAVGDYAKSIRHQWLVRHWLCSYENFLQVSTVESCCSFSRDTVSEIMCLWTQILYTTENNKNLSPNLNFKLNQHCSDTAEIRSLSNIPVNTRK